MSTLLRIKRSATAGNPPTLAAGELAYSNLTNNGSNGGQTLYFGFGTETGGNAAQHIAIGGEYFVNQINAATSLNTVSTLVKRDASGDFSAGTITASLAGTASTATALATGRTISITGDIAYTSAAFDGSGNVTGTGTLATVNTNVGSFGSSTAIPVITVNGKGLITAVSTATISTSLGIAGSTGTGSIALGTDTLTISGGTGVTSSYNNATKTLSLSIGQDVSTTSNVTFNNVSVNGSLNSDDITAANISVAGNATITGNLTVQGTTTTINSTTVSVSDLNITVAKDATTAVAADGAGLTVNGPTVSPTILYASTDDSWNFNKKVNAPSGITANVTGSLVGNADTATKLATARTISITGDIAYTSAAFDGSGNVTAAATLATVNSNVGSFGSSTSVATFTVNGKGLITAAGSSAIPTASTSVLGLASFDSTNFTVTSGAVAITSIDGGTY